MDYVDLSLRLLVLMGSLATLAGAIRRARAAGYSVIRMVATTIVFGLLLLLGVMLAIMYGLYVWPRWWPAAIVAAIAYCYLGFRLSTWIATPS